MCTARFRQEVGTDFAGSLVEGSRDSMKPLGKNGHMKALLRKSRREAAIKRLARMKANRKSEWAGFKILAGKQI